MHDDDDIQCLIDLFLWCVGAYKRLPVVWRAVLLVIAFALVFLLYILFPPF